MQRQRVHGGEIGFAAGQECLLQPQFRFTGLTAHRHHAAEVLGHHRQAALCQVADAVGQIGVGAFHNGFIAVAAVFAEGDFAAQEPAQAIDAEAVHHGGRIDDIAERFRHFLAAVEQEAVAEHGFRQRNAGRDQEGRPIDGVEAHHILAHNVQIRRPPFAVETARTGEIIGQRVEPDIHHMAFVSGHRNAPGEAGAADRQIRKPAGNKGAHLVETAGGLDILRVAVIQRQQSVLIGGQLEEPAFLHRPFHRRALR